MGNGTLYKHAMIFTGDPACPFLPDGYMLVEDGKVAAIGGTCPDSALPKAQVQRDLCGQFLMPGLISTHCHFYGQFARGMPLHQPVGNWQQVLSRMWWKMDRALDEEGTYYSAMMGLAEGLKAGTTTYFDHQASPEAIEGSLDLLEQAVRTAGARACLAYEVTDRNGTDGARRGIEENRRFLKKARPNQDRIQGLFGLHASYTLSQETLEQCAQAGKALQAGFHLHLAESTADVCDGYKQYDMHVVERMEQAGILNEKTICAHGVHLDSTQFEILRRTGVTVAHNCQSNTNNAVGIAPVEAMLQHGVHVAIGGDGYTYNLFSELGFAGIQQRLRAGTPAAFPGSAMEQLAFVNPSRLAETVFGCRIGQLSAGAAADFLILDYDPPTPVTEQNYLAHLLGGMDRCLRTVVVAGETVVQDRQCVRFDEREIFAKCREAAARLWANME